jgi:phenylpyruvate tautomerase PptA (4-oxalocrotonate tautomerase family)
MPTIDITLQRGRTSAQLRTIADAIHDALVTEFGVPPEDRFQVIHQCDPDELIYDPTYLGGPRTDAFLMVRVLAAAPRPVEVKQAFFTTVVANLSERCGVDPEDVFIVLDHVDRTDFSFAGGRPFDPPHLRNTNLRRESLPARRS